MNNFNIAILQLVPGKTIQENLQKGLDACKQAKAQGADLALFPEMWQIGYDFQLMQEENAISYDDDFIKKFIALAQELQMAIAITYLGRTPGGPTNNVAIIDAQGKIILDYAKVHVCSFEDGTEYNLAGGEGFKVATLNYGRDTVKLGAMICFDREFPESARTLMLQGVELIIVPNSCSMMDDPELSDIRLAQLRSRAFENMLCIALANYAAPKNDGSSCGIDPDGRMIARADQKEQILMAHFDIDALRNWRKNEVWGSQWRRPECYKL